MDFLNRRVNPPILIRCTPSKSSSSLGKIQYIDPEDGMRFKSSDLTDEEMGKVLQWSVSDTHRVNIYLPYRIMCKRLGSLLRGLRSFRAENPTIFSREPSEAQRRRLTACLSDFSLTEQDWEVLRSRASSANWVVEKYSLDIEYISEEISSLREKTSEILGLIKSIRKKCSPSYLEEVFSEEDLSNYLSQLEQVKEFTAEAKVKRVELLSKLDKAHLLSVPERVKVQSEFESLDKAITSLDQLDMLRYEREVLHKYRVSVGEEVEPTHMRTLSEELSTLKHYFPVLGMLKAVGDNIVISIAGVDMTLSEDSVSVKGDLSNLAKFSEETISVNKKGGRNRFKSILRKEEEN